MGKTRFRLIRTGFDEDYPHSCGEYLVKVSTVSLARGYPRSCGEYSFDEDVEIIDKGSPHSCGESTATNRAVSASLGSPPHMWGKCDSFIYP